MGQEVAWVWLCSSPCSFSARGTVANGPTSTAQWDDAVRCGCRCLGPTLIHQGLALKTDGSSFFAGATGAACALLAFSVLISESVRKGKKGVLRARLEG